MSRDEGSRRLPVHDHDRASWAPSSGGRGQAAGRDDLGEGPSLEIVISQTGAADAIVGVSEREGADLVVIGSRRPPELGGLLLGSVAHGVIHRMSRPILLAGRISGRDPRKGDEQRGKVRMSDGIARAQVRQATWI